ncbi:hypothetical protein, partial [Rheinheimera gaetbuli]
MNSYAAAGERQGCCEYKMFQTFLSHSFSLARAGSPPGQRKAKSPTLSRRACLLIGSLAVNY